MAKKESTKKTAKATKTTTKTTAKPTPAKKTVKASAPKAKPTVKAKAASKATPKKDPVEMRSSLYLTTARETLDDIKKKLEAAIADLEDVRDIVDEAPRVIAGK